MIYPKPIAYFFLNSYKKLGIVTQPVKAVNNEGAIGLVKGAAKGVTGIVTKPIAGIFDAASLTSQGFKNTVVQDELKYQRSRLPRMFYGNDKYYKDFNFEDGRIKEILDNWKKGTYSKVSYVDKDYIKLKEGTKENTYLLIISIEYLLLINPDNLEKKWKLPISAVLDIENHSSGIYIPLKVKTKAFMVLI